MGKKKSRRQGTDAGLSITSMMDMMTIILVFLLKNYSTTDISVAPSDDLQIPLSVAKNKAFAGRDVLLGHSFQEGRFSFEFRALREEAGAVPDLWSAIAQEIGVEESGEKEMDVPEDLIRAVGEVVASKKGQVVEEEGCGHCTSQLLLRF